MSKKLILRDSSFNGIVGAKKQMESPKATAVQKYHLDAANREIKTQHRKEAMAYESARVYSGI